MCIQIYHGQTSSEERSSHDASYCDTETTDRELEVLLSMYFPFQEESGAEVNDKLPSVTQVHLNPPARYIRRQRSAAQKYSSESFFEADSA